MESLVSASLEEICSHGSSGCSLCNLWQGIEQVAADAGLPINSTGVKNALWKRLLAVPGIHLLINKVKQPSLSPIDDLTAAESTKGLSIAAPEHMRDSFLGIYDLTASGVVIPNDQRQVLERLGKAGKKGVTQSQLAKESNQKGNEFFYRVKKLETRGLVVRQSAVVKTREQNSKDEDLGNSCSVASTNLIHLARYATKDSILGSSFQRVEIKKSAESESIVDDLNIDCDRVGDGDGMREDRKIKDFLPVMKNVCNLLEEANGKVLVVSDVKRNLNFSGSSGKHREWRIVLKKLKEANLVEEFDAEVNKKTVRCLRLLKEFDSGDFSLPKSTKSDVSTSEHVDVKVSKHGHPTEQVMELPIEQQIYDIIDAQGPSGITVLEVCRRLGIECKKYHSTCMNMVSRFGLCKQAESCKRTMVYRLWAPTRSSRDDGLDKTCRGFTVNRDKNVLDSVSTSPEKGKEIVVHESVVPYNNQGLVLEPGSSPVPGLIAGDGESERNCLVSSEKEALKDVTSYQVDNTSVSNMTVSDTGDVYGTKDNNRNNAQDDRQRHLSIALATENASRQERILGRLQDEKCLLVAELYKWLEGLEKDKPTKMARKTLVRVLSKLQEEGSCKCILLKVPGTTNCGRSRSIEVILHPSVDLEQPGLLDQIHERFRQFEIQCRSPGMAMPSLKYKESIPVLAVERTCPVQQSDAPEVVESMLANGYVHAKMIRVKLLHRFLWDHVSSSPLWHDSFSGDCNFSQESFDRSVAFFSLDDATKAMPLEAYLQIVGCRQKSKILIESCRLGLRLSQLAFDDLKSLMSTQATGRLSRLVDILRRLKLLKLVRSHEQAGREVVTNAVLTYALELKPYIEEPAVMPFSDVNQNEHRPPKVRHDFVFSSKDMVDAYWKTLEYCYCTADPIATKQVFPGSAVPEVSHSKAWSAFRVMTAEQRMELYKRIEGDNIDKRIPFKDCVKIAKDLGLTLEQVLKVSYDKNRKSRLQQSQNQPNAARYKRGSSEVTPQLGTSHKRKKASVELSLDHDYLNSLQVENLDVNASLPLSFKDATLECNIEPDGDLLSALETSKRGGSHENDQPRDEDDGSIHGYAFSRLRPTRSKRFLWTGNADRQLVMQYARSRVLKGTKIDRVEWSYVPDLPAAPNPCRRRISLMKSDPHARSSLMKLCNLLGERYAKYLTENEGCQVASRLPHDTATTMSTSLSELEENSLIRANGLKKAESANVQNLIWDDFADPDVKLAVDEVLKCNQISRLKNLKKSHMKPHEELSVLSLQDRENLNKHMPGNSPSIDTNKIMTSGDIRNKQVYPVVEENGRLSCVGPVGPEEAYDNQGLESGSKSLSGIHRTSPCFSEKTKISKSHKDSLMAPPKSLAVANAVELIKLVFLNASIGSEVPNILLEKLRSYDEHDVLAAFSYLRAKGFVVIGRGGQPFVLSSLFFKKVFTSPFPVRTGAKSIKLAKWLHDRKSDLIEDGVSLFADVHCGDIFHLFSLVSSGKIIISPSLPNEGVGETSPVSGLKRKLDKETVSKSNAPKKRVRPTDVESGYFYSRREKGFPDLKVRVNFVSLSRAEALELEVNEGKGISLVSCSPRSNSGSSSILDTLCLDKFITADLDTILADDSLWKAVSCFLSAMSSFSHTSLLFQELVKSIYCAIHKSADLGLSLDDVRISVAGESRELAVSVIDLLQTFGLVVKVNAFDHTRVVAQPFSAKYSLTTAIDDDKNGHHEEHETVMTLSDGHRVTIMGASDVKPCNITHSSSETPRFKDQMKKWVSLDTTSRAKKEGSSGTGEFRPLLPWLNYDGSTNLIVYKALTRRVVGIVMQNPGILEDDLVNLMSSLNPQSCRKLMALLVLENHLIMRRMHQTTCCTPPAILRSILGTKFLTRSNSSTYKIHYFANPMSTSML